MNNIRFSTPSKDKIVHEKVENEKIIKSDIFFISEIMTSKVSFPVTRLPLNIAKVEVFNNIFLTKKYLIEFLSSCV